MHEVEAKGILTGGKGRYGMNVYRGCTHGCIYCDSRSKCYRFAHPFEEIEVKRNAPELLERALRSMIGRNAEEYIRTYGNAYEVPSPNRERLMRLFRTFCSDHGILYRPDECFTFMGQFPEKTRQLSLLDRETTEEGDSPCRRRF